VTGNLGDPPHRGEQSCNETKGNNLMDHNYLCCNHHGNFRRNGVCSLRGVYEAACTTRLPSRSDGSCAWHVADSGQQFAAENRAAFDSPLVVSCRNELHDRSASVARGIGVDRVAVRATLILDLTAPLIIAYVHVGLLVLVLKFVGDALDQNR
jgi:hypothetical protein